MSFIDRLLGRAQPPKPSGKVAKERLKFVLEYDRARLTPAQLEEIKDEIIAVISRHVDIADRGVEIKLEEGGRLVAEISLSDRVSAAGRRLSGQ